MSSCTHTISMLMFSSCLRNVVAIFHHIEKEMAWRKSLGRPEGFDMLKKVKPIGNTINHNDHRDRKF
jgi:hypothetical protein